MKTMKKALAVAMGVVVAAFLVRTGYVLAERQNSVHYVRADDLAKIKEGMPFEVVETILGRPDSRTVSHDEGGADPGLFSATWKSADGSVVIDFNAFEVVHIESKVKTKPSQREAASPLRP